MMTQIIFNTFQKKEVSKMIIMLYYFKSFFCCQLQHSDLLIPVFLDSFSLFFKEMRNHENIFDKKFKQLLQKEEKSSKSFKQLVLEVQQSYVINLQSIFTICLSKQGHSLVMTGGSLSYDCLLRKVQEIAVELLD